MTTFRSCDHAIKCDKCRLYYCANDEIITCKSCCGPSFCSECFVIKEQDPVMYEWFCHNKLCIKEARQNKKPCSNCRSNCINHKKILSNGLYLCRRCTWRSVKRKQRQKKL